MLRIEARASKRCEDCFNDGVREALSWVIKNIDHQLGYLSDPHSDTAEILKRLRLLIQNDIEVWENRKGGGGTEMTIKQAIYDLIGASMSDEQIQEVADAFITHSIDRVLEIIDEESTRNGMNLKQTAEIRRRVAELKGR